MEGSQPTGIGRCARNFPRGFNFAGNYEALVSFRAFDILPSSISVKRVTVGRIKAFFYS